MAQVSHGGLGSGQRIAGAGVIRPRLSGRASVLRITATLLVTGAVSAHAADTYDPHQSPPTLPRHIIDWMTPDGAKELREMPEDNLVALENPPAFGWRSGQDR